MQSIAPASVRLSFERLESRWCPALTAALHGGTLVISGRAESADGSIRIEQDATTAGTFNVFDGDTLVNEEPFEDVTSLRLDLEDADDSLVIDLGGLEFGGTQASFIAKAGRGRGRGPSNLITADLGDGENSLTITNGTTVGRISVVGGEGDDTVTLAGGDAGLTITNAEIALGDGLDTVDVQAGVEVTGRLATYHANTVTLAADSLVNNLAIRGGTGGNTIAIDGDVTGSAVIDAFYRSGSSAGTTVDVNGTIDGSLVFSGSDLDDVLTVTGDVGQGVSVAMYGGGDAVTISGGITRRLTIDSGAGADEITLGGAVGGRTNVNAGSGDDVLVIGADAEFVGAATVSLGAGADKATLDNAAGIATLVINGGTGVDAFTGTTPRTGLTLISF